MPAVLDGITANTSLLSFLIPDDQSEQLQGLKRNLYSSLTGLRRLNPFHLSLLWPPFWQDLSQPHPPHHLGPRATRRPLLLRGTHLPHGETDRLGAAQTDGAA